MAVSLAESKNNAQTDYDPAVIDEFRKESPILDSLIFDDSVNPSGGGGTPTYGYRRQITQGTASFRKINSEYTPGEVTTQKYTVDLVPLGGSFEVDRVVAKIGPAASDAVKVNLQEKIKATRTRFQDAVINGDVHGTEADAEDGFDGLNVALANSSTEFRGDKVTDWTSLSGSNNNDASMTALDDLDEFLSMLDGTPTVVVGNRNALARVRSVARRAGMYNVNPVDGLVGSDGRPITRETYGSVLFVDAGEKAGSSDLIIPNVTRNTKWKVTVATGTGKGTYTLTVDGQTTEVLAGDANNATVQAALEALPIVGAGGVSGTSLTFEFARAVSVTLQVVTPADTTDASIATAGGTGNTGLTDLYAYRIGLNGFHGVSMSGGQLVQTWLPQFNTPGAVKKGEVELGPVAVALKATRAAAVFRNIKVK